MANQKYEAFLTVARTHSFKKAAEEMGYTQAGIGYLINALEREIGLRLFARDYGDTHLTAEGRDLLPWIQAAATSENQLETRIFELKNLEGGLVRVGAFTSTSIQWFPGIAKAFFEQYPLIDLKLLCIDDDKELGDDIWNGVADCGFCVYPTEHKFHSISLRKDPLCVVLSPTHPLAHAPYFPREALAQEPYIQLMSNAGPANMVSLFKANGVEPNVRFTVDSDYAVMSMVSAGLGFSVLPDLILRDPPFPIAVLPAEVQASREIGIAVRSLETASAATKAFLNVTQEWVAEHYAHENEFGTSSE